MLLHVNPETGSSKRSQGGCGSGSTSALIQEIFNIAVKGRRADGALETPPYIYIHIFLLILKDCRADGALEACPPRYRRFVSIETFTGRSEDGALVAHPSGYKTSSQSYRKVAWRMGLWRHVHILQGGRGSGSTSALLQEIRMYIYIIIYLGVHLL